jgi:hypothetical protein
MATRRLATRKAGKKEKRRKPFPANFQTWNNVHSE